MSNCESNDRHYSGLLVEYVELKPFKGSYEAPADESVIRYPVKKISKSSVTIDFMDSPVFQMDIIPTNAAIPITR
ncbi:hypothetical protein BGX34_000181, partial [Mortierella sp. NVP85]